MPSEDASSSQPLLPISQESEDSQSKSGFTVETYNVARGKVRKFLESRAQHWTVLSLVSFDLLGIFADIIINLYQCDQKQTGKRWDDAREGLGIAGLVFSCLFMLELLLSIWAFGWSYFKSKFHCFDATVIVAGFITDVLLHGVLEEVASLVVILRLWRFFKIIEEFSVGAEEQMEGLEMRIEKLEAENSDLRHELMKQKGILDEEEQVGFQSGSGSCE